MQSRFDHLRPAFFLCGLIAFLNLYSTQSILDPLSRAFSVSHSAVGWTISATTLSVALFAPFVHRFTRGMNPLRVISVTSLAICLPVVATALAGSYSAFLISRFAIGICIPLIFATSIAQIGDLWREPNHVKEVTSLYVAGTVFGGFLGRFISGVLTDMAGWRFAFAAMGGLTLLIGCVIAFFFNKSQANGCALHPISKPDRVRTNRRFEMPLVAAYAIGFLILFGQVAMFTYSTLRLSAPPFALSSSAVGSVYAVFLLALVVVPVAGRKAREYSSTRIVCSASVLGLLGTIAATSDSLWLVLMGLALSSTSVFVTQAACNAFIASQAGEDKAGSVGLYLCAYYLGGTIGAIGPSPVWTQFGWTGCAVVIAVCQLLPAVISWRAWRDVPVDEVAESLPQEAADRG